MKIGDAPTAFHARNGEFTAPGILTLARLKRSFECLREVITFPCGSHRSIEKMLRRANKFPRKRGETRKEQVSTQKISIAQIRSESHRRRSRDRRTSGVDLHASLVRSMCREIPFSIRSPCGEFFSALVITAK